jgi:hypothetical protein
MQTGKFMRVIDIVAAARDESGRPVLKSQVHAALAEYCERGVTAIGHPCDKNGVPGAHVVIPVEHWRLMAFPIAARGEREHATFWHPASPQALEWARATADSQHHSWIAYIDIGINVEEGLSYQARLFARDAKLEQLLSDPAVPSPACHHRRARRRRHRPSPKADRIRRWLKLHHQRVARLNPNAAVIAWLNDPKRHGGKGRGGKKHACESYANRIITDWKNERN